MDWTRLEKWIGDNHIGACVPMAPLADFTTWKIGGPARLLVRPEGEAQFSALLQYCSAHAYPVRYLGLGSNLLVADEGVEALVAFTGLLQNREWSPAEKPGYTRVWAGAGLPLAKLLEGAIERGLGGLEFTAGIPGSFGGALVMNAGTDRQISDVLETVRLLDSDGRFHILQKEELTFGYRTGSLRQSDRLVVAGSLLLPAGDPQRSRAQIEHNLAERRQKQPLDQPSGGSVFRNPAGTGAGRYIDRAGLKGLQVGNARISEKHANFIVNLGGARAAEVRQLMEIARAEVEKQFGAALESEVVYWS